LKAYRDGIVILTVEAPTQTQRLPLASDLALAIATQIPLAMPQVEAVSDLFAAGFCAKPLFFDGLFSADPARRSLLKQVKAAKYMELSLLQSVCTEKGRYLMGAVNAGEALLHLLAQGSVRLSGGHLQTVPGKLPMEAAVDPRLEKPMVQRLHGSFWVYLRGGFGVFSALEEKKKLQVGDVTFTVEGWQSLSREEEKLSCLQAAAAVTERTVMTREASLFRLTCGGGRQYITAGSLVAPGDVPGSVVYETDGQPRYLRPYSIPVSF